jgi:hypothetical protein
VPVGDELLEADPVAEPLVEPLAEAEDVAACDDALIEEASDAVLLLLALDAPEGEAVADDDREEPDPPVAVRLAAVLDGRTSELDGVGLSSISTTILISVHWSPIHSSYKLPNLPLMHRHHLVEPPIASELFLHTENPPV